MRSVDEHEMGVKTAVLSFHGRIKKSKVFGITGRQKMNLVRFSNRPSSASYFIISLLRAKKEGRINNKNYTLQNRHMCKQKKSGNIAGALHVVLLLAAAVVPLKMKAARA